MILGVFIGAIIWMLLSLNKVYHKTDFLWSKFILTNWLPFLINFICGLTILWFGEEIKEILPLTKVNTVIIGFSGQALFKKIVGIFDKNIETNIGINKKHI